MNFIFDKDNQKLFKNNTSFNITGFLLVLIVCSLSRATVAEQTTRTGAADSLMNNAYKAYLSGDYQKAITDWNEIIDSEDINSRDLALIHENVASVQRYLGFPGKAIQAWQESIEIYTEQKHWRSQLRLAAALIDQSQAYNDLGQPRFSIPLIRKALSIIEQSSKQNLRSDSAESIDKQISAQALQTLNLEKLRQMAHFSLGNAYSVQGNYDRGIDAYKKSLQAQSIDKNDASLVMSTYTNLSQIYQQKFLIAKQKAILAEQEDDPVAASFKQKAIKYFYTRRVYVNIASTWNLNAIISQR